MVCHPLLTHEVAEIVGRSPSRIRQLVREGRLKPAVRTPSGVSLFEAEGIKDAFARAEARRD